MRATPGAWVGAPSRGGLALPDARPSASTLYAPRGVWLDDQRLVVVDSGNHRVLIWFDRPGGDHMPADVVLGQAGLDREGPRAGGRGAANGLHLPTGVMVIDGRLFVADAWHHRILVWDRIPEASDTPPDMVLGQPDAERVQPNAGGAVSASTFYWPYGLGFVAGRFIVTDTGNRRVLVWNGVPEPGQPADAVIGQDAPDLALENRGGAPIAKSFRWPHAVAGDERTLFVADAGNHRVLAWSPLPDGDRDADAVIGQCDFTSNAEFPYIRQTSHSLRFPYALASDDRWLLVADTATRPAAPAWARSTSEASSRTSAWHTCRISGWATIRWCTWALASRAWTRRRRCRRSTPSGRWACSRKSSEAGKNGEDRHEISGRVPQRGPEDIHPRRGPSWRSAAARPTRSSATASTSCCPPSIELVHGPGCPVCVTPLDVIDRRWPSPANPTSSSARSATCCACPAAARICSR
jgi:hypothetical protein